MSLEFPQRVEISLRLYHDLLVMLEYSLGSDKEVGGLLIKAKHGHFGVIAEQFGEGREIVLEPNEEMYEGEIYFGTCVKPDTLILGDNKQISEYGIQDTVVGKGGLQSVVNTMSRPYKGQMIKIRGGGLFPVETTPEHPLLVSTVNTTRHEHKPQFTEPYWKLAKDIVPKITKQDGDYLVIPRIKGNIEINTLSLVPFSKGNLWSSKTKELSFTNDIAWLLGLYVAEGYNRGEKNGFGFSLASNEMALAQKIKDILFVFGAKVTIRNVANVNGIKIECYWPVLGRALKEWCGKDAHHKQIPEFVLYNTNNNILRSFVEGYEIGDGSIKKSGWCECSTVSKLLSMQLQLAYARLGVFASLYTRDRRNKLRYIYGRQLNGELSYSVLRPPYDLKQTHNKLFENYMLVPVREKTVSFYEGTVNNLETKDNTYLVNNAVVHNCHIHPVTEVFSTGDVISYLADPLERVMVLMGSDGSVNVAIKPPATIKEGNFEQEIRDTYEQKDMKEMANKYGFLWYKSVEADENTLTLQNDALLDAQITPKNTVEDIEDVVSELGIEGSPDLPEGYGTKKKPLPKKEGKCPACGGKGEWEIIVKQPDTGRLIKCKWCGGSGDRKDCDGAEEIEEDIVSGIKTVDDYMDESAEPKEREYEPEDDPKYGKREGKASDIDKEKAYRIVERLSTQNPPYENSDAMFKDVEFLVDTDLHSLLQPPNVSEGIYETYRPIIDHYLGKHGVGQATPGQAGLEEEDIELHTHAELTCPKCGHIWEEDDIVSYADPPFHSDTIELTVTINCPECDEEFNAEVEFNTTDIKHEDECSVCGYKYGMEPFTFKQVPKKESPTQDAWCYLHDKEINKHTDDEIDEDEEKGTERYEEWSSTEIDEKIKKMLTLPDDSLVRRYSELNDKRITQGLNKEDNYEWTMLFHFISDSSALQKQMKQLECLREETKKSEEIIKKNLRDPSVWTDYVGVELSHGTDSETITNKWKEAINFNPAQDKILLDDFDKRKWNLIEVIDELMGGKKWTPEAVQDAVELYKSTA